MSQQATHEETVGQVLEHATTAWLDSMIMDPFLGCDSPVHHVPPHHTPHHRHPKLDVYESDTHIKLIFSVPGLKKEDLKIDIDDTHHILTISGEIPAIVGDDRNHGEHSHLVIASERFSGPFVRSIHLPKYVDTLSVKARLESGLLSIVFPKIIKEASVRNVNLD